MSDETENKVEIREKSVTLELPVNLTKTEVIERKNELLKLLDQRDVCAAEARSASSDFRARLKVMDNKIVELRTSLRTDKEKRPVPCDQHYDWAKQTVTVYRSDTGGRVHERAMFKSEKQKTVDECVEDAKAKKDKKAKETKGEVLPMTKKGS